MVTVTQGEKLVWDPHLTRLSHLLQEWSYFVVQVSTGYKHFFVYDPTYFWPFVVTKSIEAEVRNILRIS